MTDDKNDKTEQTKPKFYCSLEAWKRHTDEAKKLYSITRPLIVQEERLEMAKNHQRYIDEEMKKYAEQQAKHRDPESAMASQEELKSPQQIAPDHSAPAPGSSDS